MLARNQATQAECGASTVMLDQARIVQVNVNVKVKVNVNVKVNVIVQVNVNVNVKFTL